MGIVGRHLREYAPRSRRFVRNSTGSLARFPHCCPILKDRINNPWVGLSSRWNIWRGCICPWQKGRSPGADDVRMDVHEFLSSRLETQQVATAPGASMDLCTNEAALQPGQLGKDPEQPVVKRHNLSDGTRDVMSTSQHYVAFVAGRWQNTSLRVGDELHRRPEYRFQVLLFRHGELRRCASDCTGKK